MAAESFNLSTPSNFTNHCTISKVRVITRVRPFLSQEISSKIRAPISCISMLDQPCRSQEEVTVHIKDSETSRNECYQLDSFFGQEDHTVRQIFEKEVNPLIPGIFQGSNATVFSYGATGSGKTFTMQGNDEEPGIMPLAMSEILSICKRTDSKAEISYYEVYLDRCYDLLEPKAKEIVILDDKEGQIHLRGLSKVVIDSMFEFREVLSCGIHRRKVAHTDLNDVSSRSHGVLVITVSSSNCDDSGATFTGKLNLIDLAGNEDNRRTCNEGIRIQESAKINQSLFALSNVIYALNKNLARVPYRESKLTRILQDSLGGTSRALMIACLNPGEYQESVHTISLAARSRQISNFVLSAHKQETPQAKVDMEAKLRAWLESKGKTKSTQRTAAFGSPFSSKTPCPTVESLRKALFKSSSKAKMSASRSACNAKERTKSVAVRSLIENEGEIHSCLERLDFNDEDNKGIHKKADMKVSAEEILSNSTAKDIDAVVKEKFNSPRKALSPIDNMNGMQREFLFADQSLTPTTFKSRTLKTSFPPNEEFKSFGTPLDKYDAQMSNLKSCLVQEYMDFLNSASREELVELKGIGVKMAEYIIELRETSPLKSLNDLKKIGLSFKQIQNLLNKAARGIFDRPGDMADTPYSVTSLSHQ